MSKKRTTVVNVTAELNQHLGSPVSMITIRRHFHKRNIYGRAAIPKPLVTDVNAKHRLQWCHTHKTCSIDRWRIVIWCSKSSFTIFPTTEQFHDWGTPPQTYGRNCVLPTANHVGGSDIIWTAA
ncbi:DDE_3 domain-containing protein [Trichonephila clavipes]|nr:DDE_3 domain-containing protein [Trichonephila clavipes]